MEIMDSSNKVFNLAADLVLRTSQHVFITGKAGTGKTSFLKFITGQRQKNTVVVAPTGVAAINAGGVTMHSLFQLPFVPYSPEPINRLEGHVGATDKHGFLRNTRFSKSKRELYQEMELLIIDEVSMLRCDMLDAIDAILRHFRRQPQLAFGGVQLAYIGDMFQLPPVIPPQEWDILKNYYEVPFFFGSRVVNEAPPLYIELRKIYRQNEQRFIDILNRVRNNMMEPDDFEVLNSRYHPGFQPPSQNGPKFITLTTHNSKADVINESELAKLPGAGSVFRAEIEGEFSDKALPTEMNLRLKEGAQVMFIKNDSGNDRRYYNGRLALVKKILNDEIIVSFNNGEEDLKLEKETWKNVRYNYNREKDRIEEEELGSFSQFPVRLAWAITIHKSQGLSFERAVIDAGASFAAGQVYVALSRCTSLEGLILRSRLSPRTVATDPRIIEFARREAADDVLERLLRDEREKAEAERLLKTFGWGKILGILEQWRELILEKSLPFQDEAATLHEALLAKAQEQAEVAAKFQNQLRQLLLSRDGDMLQQRVNKAILYFGRFLAEQLIVPVREHLFALRLASKSKRYLGELSALEAGLLAQLGKFNQLKFGDLSFVRYEFQVSPVIEPVSGRTKPPKGASRLQTLELYREGKSIDEIALLRRLAASTVEGHLADLVYTGDLPVDELVEQSKKEVILNLVAGSKLSASEVKARLGDDFSFGEIRAVINHCRFLDEGKQAN